MDKIFFLKNHPDHPDHPYKISMLDHVFNPDRTRTDPDRP